ncbi:TMAO reductase system periplasmic protein TorT [Defluviimonas sp. WL0075]|uniref:TMAO reductase system periplasmic protein TorT n=1 Tax=Albidovulum sediminicola TaxID=2984331 RepID=A0ABT2Z775_9RHOB|nr:TMAO reductase system periplasmic protein TorT [Defluviimonas sp. WL0075]MCV2866626.1 TMAO reductase system periplasmic protein TorT [Defluviimonas sp. WL0075]
MLRFLLALLLPWPLLAGAENWQIEYRDPPFDFSRPAHIADYTPLEHAAQAWRFCVAYPHLKDAYWLSVNYGMVEEARRLGVTFHLVEAGGYPNLDRQKEQIEDCVAQGADGLIVGTVSFEGLSDVLERIAQTIPVIASVNDIADRGITAKIGVSWFDMGAAAGRVVAEAHPAGSDPVRVAWFPGPDGAGWVRFVDAGFRAALRGSSAEIVDTAYGDTGLEIQVRLVETALEAHPDIDYIVGSAPTAEAAVSILRARGLEGRIRIVSDYMTHAVMRGLQRGKIIAAPTDFPVFQGRLSIEMAVRAVEGQLAFAHAGPGIALVRAGSASAARATESFAPASFVPVFDLE